MKSFQTAGKALGMIVLITLFALGLNYVLSNLRPNPQPAKKTEKPFVCEVTQPNGETPPFEQPSPAHHGNGKIWTGLWDDGKVIMTDQNREADGSYSMKWWWWRGGSGYLTIEGKRLDADADPLRADIPDGYGDTGFQVAALIFPTEGCWEVTGQVGDDSLTFITEVVIATDEPAPVEEPAPTETPALAPNVYDRMGITITLNARFPSAPGEVNVLTHTLDQNDPTVEEAKAFAEKFGVRGEAYDAPEGMQGGKAFVITDGKQRMFYRSENNFNYYSDYTYFPKPINPLYDPSNAIDEFLKAHGYDFEYQIIPSALGNGWFTVLPLSADGHAIWFENQMPNGIQIEVTDQGQVIDFVYQLVSVDPNPVGAYTIINAEEAWRKYIEDGYTLGTLEYFRSRSNFFPTWHREYADGEPAFLYGQISILSSAEGNAPLITIDNVALTGSISGLENLKDYDFAFAQGSFVTENNIRAFNVDTWTSTSELPFYAYGPMQVKDGQGWLSADDGKVYILKNLPADLTENLANASVSGIIEGDQIDWMIITDFGENANGGGGGGGQIAKLNLSGDPVAWSTPTPTPAPQTGAQVENLRGMVSISIYENADGSQRSEIILVTADQSYLLEGNSEAWKNFHNLPAVVWGSINAYTEYQTPIITVDRFEVPFPDLQFQIVRGTQRLTTLEGQDVILFTAQDGSTYAQLIPSGYPDSGLIGYAGDEVVSEVLIIPDETFGGYPAMRVFGSSLSINPDGSQYTPDLTAGTPYVIPVNPEVDFAPPSLTIESIELVYFTNDIRYAPYQPEMMSPYLQPMWLFRGYNSMGDEYTILIQALDQQYLLPEPADVIQGG